jgi:hypothetical protein
MAKKTLNHPEDEQLQNQVVNAGASQEAQPNAETELPKKTKKPKAESRIAVSFN